MIHDVTKLALALRRFGRRESPPPAPTGIVIGEQSSGVPVCWPSSSLQHASHVAVLAASGAGKTVAVGHALVDEIVAPPPPAGAGSVVVIDPKGDLVETILAALCAREPGALARVRYLDPFGPSGFPFNLCHLPLGQTPLDIRAMQVADLVSVVSTSVGAQAHLGTGARQVDALTNLILAALSSEAEGRSVLFALDALFDRSGPARLAAVTTSLRAREFLQSSPLSDELRISCASRLRTAFGLTSRLEALVSTPRCLSPASLVEPGAITLVHLGAPPGGLERLSAFWANLLLRVLVEHLMERPSPFAGHGTRLVLDEVQVLAPVLADVAERLLTLGRSRNLSLVVLSQGTTLLRDASDTLLRVLLTNTPTKIIGRLAPADAELLAREVAASPGVDESTSAVRSRFAASVAGLADREFMLLRPSERARFVSRPVDMAARAAAREAHAADVGRLMAAFAVEDTAERPRLPALPARGRRGGQRPGPNGPPPPRRAPARQPAQDQPPSERRPAPPPAPPPRQDDLFPTPDSPPRPPSGRRRAPRGRWGGDS